MKQEIIVRREFKKYDIHWPTTNASGFMAWFQSRILEIPEESRDSLTIDIDSDDSGCAVIEFAYTRIETDDEEAIRKKYISSWEAVSGYPIGTWSNRDE